MNHKEGSEMILYMKHPEKNKKYCVTYGTLF